MQINESTKQGMFQHNEILGISYALHML